MPGPTCRYTGDRMVATASPDCTSVSAPGPDCAVRPGTADATSGSSSSHALGCSRLNSVSPTEHGRDSLRTLAPSRVCACVLLPSNALSGTSVAAWLLAHALRWLASSRMRRYSTPVTLGTTRMRSPGGTTPSVVASFTLTSVTLPSTSYTRTCSGSPPSTRPGTRPGVNATTK